MEEWHKQAEGEFHAEVVKIVLSVSAELGKKIQALASVEASSPGRATAHSNIQQDLVHLRTSLNADALPAFERRKREQALDTLETALAAADKPTASKFSFKKRAPPRIGQVETTVQAAEPVQTSHSAPAAASNKEQTLCQHIRLSDTNDATAEGNTTTFANLRSCILDARGQTLPALFLSSIANSIILAPSVTGSVFLTNVNDSTVLVGCHQVGSDRVQQRLHTETIRQFRMHNSRNVKLLLTTPIVPIIEDCSDIRIARVPCLSNDRTGPLSIADFNNPSGKSGNNWSLLSTSETEALQQNLGGIPHTAMLSEQVKQTLNLFSIHAVSPATI